LTHNKQQTVEQVVLHRCNPFARCFVVQVLGRIPVCSVSGSALHCGALPCLACADNTVSVLVSSHLRTNGRGWHCRSIQHAVWNPFPHHASNIFVSASHHITSHRITCVVHAMRKHRLRVVPDLRCGAFRCVLSPGLKARLGSARL